MATTKQLILDLRSQVAQQGQQLEAQQQEIAALRRTLYNRRDSVSSRSPVNESTLNGSARIRRISGDPYQIIEEDGEAVQLRLSMDKL